MGALKNKTTKSVNIDTVMLAAIDRVLENLDEAVNFTDFVNASLNKLVNGSIDDVKKTLANYYRDRGNWQAKAVQDEKLAKIRTEESNK